mmetsp:Transcript_99024/g.144847  ORF Transcript_99024/g.144847 Transcript_99024/m.144847 type:complete len:98 (-) Transcript_99024:11-304(-)
MCAHTDTMMDLRLRPIHFTCLSLINSRLSWTSLCPLSYCKYVLASMLPSCCPTVTRFHGALCISTCDHQILVPSSFFLSFSLSPPSLPGDSTSQPQP